MKNKEPRQKRASLYDAHFYNILDYFILAVLVAGVLMFILYPLFCMIKQSFIGDTGFTTEVYQSIFTEHIKLVKNSTFVGLLTAFFSTVFGLFVAISVWAAGRKTGKVLESILLISMVSPPFVSSLAYIQLFGRNGLITKRLLGLSINPYGWLGVVVMQTLFFASLNALMILGMLRKMDMSLVRASSDLGAGSGYTLWRIVIPLLRPILLSCFLLSFIRSVSDYGTPVVIGGRFETVSTEIYMQVIGYSRLDKSAALNVLIMIPAILVFALYRYLMKKNERLVAGNSNKTMESGDSYRVKGVSAILVWLGAAIFYIMMALVYGSIFLNSFTKNMRGKLKFTTEYLDALLERNMDTFIRSVQYALVVAIVGTLIGILLSYYIDRRKIRFGGMLDFLITMPYMLPGSCFGIGYILAFNHEPLKLTGTALIVILNMIYKQMSITTKAASSSLMQISTDLDMAARDLGAKRFQVMKDVVLPNLRQAFATGFVNNFTSAMVTAGAVIFLVTPGQKIAVFTLFDCINTGKYAEGSMIASFIIAITISVNLLFSFIVTRKGRKKRVFRAEKRM